MSLTSSDDEDPYEHIREMAAQMSEVLRPVQESIAPMVAAIVESMKLPEIKINIPDLSGMLLDTSGLRDQLSHIEGVFGPLREAVEAQHAQLAQVFDLSPRTQRRIFPANWDGVTGLSTRKLKTLLLEEGLPLAGTLRPSTVQDLLKCSNERERRQLIGRRWRSVVSDCRDQLESVERSEIDTEVTFALRSLEALHDGHWEASQALCANLLDSVLHKHLQHFKDDVRKAHKAGHQLNIDGYVLREAWTIAPIWRAYVRYYVERNDPIPHTFARNASAHSVSRRQYSRVNAAFALMLVTSLLWFLDDQE